MDFGSFAPKSYKPNNQTPTPGGLNAVDHFKQASLELASIIGHKDHFLFSEKYGTVSNVLRIFGVMGLPPECHETTNLRICQLGVENTSTNERRSRYGDNTIGYGARYGICFFALESIKSDKTIQLLIGAATLSVILSFFAKQKEAPSSCGWIEGVAIILSVLIVTTVNAVNEFYKQDQFLFVHQEEDSHRKPITVWRYHRLDEHHQNSLELRAEEVPMAELVVGDIVRVSSGCQLTFDAILIYNNDSVVVDEVCISGESEERRKEASDDCFLISGSSVLEGSSESAAVVCAVGASSFSGSIAEFISSTEKEDTPLQKQLGVLADSIARYGIGAALATCAILILKDILSAVTAGAPLTWSKILSNVITAVTIVVVAVPEGLPLSVTIALAYSMRQMLQDGNLVRHLAACETMGGATVLCIDKTGTLTQPTMRVSHIVLGLVNYPCPSSLSGSKAKDIVRISWSSSQIQLFLDSIVWCSLDPQLGVPVNKTAEALLKMDIEFQSLEGIHHISATLNSVLTFPARKFRRFPINSIDKIGRTIIFHSDKQCHFLCGAPEIVLSISDKYVNEQGLEETLTDSSRAQHQQVVDQLSSAGHRAVCFAYTCKCADASEVATSQMRYCLLGVIALEEKLQSDAVVALEQCRSAGIRVIMITGDSRLTAVNVALRCGLFCTSKDNPYTVIDGPDFRKMRDAELIGTYLPFLCVLSRASPLDKKRLLQLLRMYNPMDVIAMTGDGTNDAPALKLSDVGFAMESGSDVAKKASDIILLGNSFSGMVRAVIWGRGIKDNIRKFLQYQLTVNVGACLIAFLGAVVNDQNISPLKPVQLLWLNLIMDSLAALALATELPTADLLRRSPESQGTPIITQPMWISVWVQCTCQLLVQFLLFWFGFGLLRSEDNHHRFSDLHICFLFNSFVWMQIFNFFNARLLDSRLPLFWGFQYSRTLLYIVGFIAVVQFVVVQYGGQWMMTVPLSYMEWIYSIAIGLLALPSGKLSRWVCCQAENSRQTFFPRLLWNILRSARKEKSKFRTAYP